MWQHANPVDIRFGAGALDHLATALRGRSYCLVTYAEPDFADLAGRVTRLAGAPILTIDTVAANPDFRMLEECCVRLACNPTAPDATVALGGGSVLDAAKVLAAADGDTEWRELSEHALEGERGQNHLAP